ncbi:hypothetical protein KEM48_011892 [Puccinia striiformis f. sp. tritici PST-130]|nr:hypothetical protein KEM48_011892 [Puccinia striiformis f. sp. tritici PST-130]
MQQFMAASGPPGPIVIPPAPAPIITPLAQSSVIVMNEGSLIMDHDYKEHLSDPPPQDTGIDQLLEENNRQEKEDPLPDDFSVKSPADLIVCPAPRPGVINLCEYDYTIGAPLDPTPVGHFLPMADLLAFCQEWAKHHGYAVLKVRSNANKNVYIRYSPSAHAAHKRVTLEQVIAIQKLSQSNIKPTQILLQLQTSNNKTYATNKTISNVLQKQRLKDLDGRTPIQALLDILKESNWTYDVKVNSSGNILSLFFAHPAPSTLLE